MNWCDMRLWCWLMPGYSARGKRMNADTLRWPFMYFPTSPDRLARPRGKRVFADTRRRCGVHTYPPATTNVLAWNSVSWAGSSRLTATAWLTRSDPCSSTRRRTSVRVTSCTLSPATSAFHVKSGEYLAPLGQIGEHVSLRQHAGRLPYAIEFLADGWPQKAMPVYSPHGFSCSRLYDSGSGGCGYGRERGSSAAGPCSPATPIP